MKTITAVTTFHPEGMQTYGQRFLDSFAKNVDNLRICEKKLQLTSPRPCRKCLKCKKLCKIFRQISPNLCYAMIFQNFHDIKIFTKMLYY